MNNSQRNLLMRTLAERKEIIENLDQAEMGKLEKKFNSRVNSNRSLEILNGLNEVETVAVPFPKIEITTLLSLDFQISIGLSHLLYSTNIASPKFGLNTAKLNSDLIQCLINDNDFITLMSLTKGEYALLGYRVDSAVESSAWTVCKPFREYFICAPGAPKELIEKIEKKLPVDRV